MEQQKESFLDSFLEPFKSPSRVVMTELTGVGGNLSGIRDAQAEGAAFSPRGQEDKADSTGLMGHSVGKAVSAVQEKQIEFCNLLWEGIHEKVLKAVAGNGPAGSGRRFGLTEENL